MFLVAVRSAGSLSKVGHGSEQLLHDPARVPAAFGALHGLKLTHLFRTWCLGLLAFAEAEACGCLAGHAMESAP